VASLGSKRRTALCDALCAPRSTRRGFHSTSTVVAMRGGRGLGRSHHRAVSGLVTCRAFACFSRFFAPRRTTDAERWARQARAPNRDCCQALAYGRHHSGFWRVSQQLGQHSYTWPMCCADGPGRHRFPSLPVASVIMTSTGAWCLTVGAAGGGQRLVGASNRFVHVASGTASKSGSELSGRSCDASLMGVYIAAVVRQAPCMPSGAGVYPPLSSVILEACRVSRYHGALSKSSLCCSTRL